MPGVWGFVGWRGAHLLLYAWEEFLLVGVALAAIGTTILFRERRAERWGLLVWMIPVIAGATLFKIEGQFDFWLVTAWMPLWACAALGLSTLRRRWPRAPQAALAVGLAWAAAANGRDLYLRGDRLPEALGRSMLGNLDPGATLIVSSDDAIGLCHYLQVVRGFRPDVRVILASMLSPAPDQAWYSARLKRKWPEFSPPDFDFLMVYAATYTPHALTQAAIVRGRKPGSPPVFFDTEPAQALLPPGSLVPAGFLWKWSERPDEKAEARYWDYPVTLEQAAERRGRRRGINVQFAPDTLWVSPQCYEDRIIYYLVQARRKLGDLAQRAGGRTGFEESARTYESIAAAAPDFALDPQIQYPLGLDYFMLDRPAEAEPLFAKVADSDAGPQLKAGARFYLGEICRASGRAAAAAEHYRRALQIVPADSPLKEELERRLH
jgi:hypothetical protein